MIVASILLAFWIDAWWDSRQARSAESALVDAVHLEAISNRENLDTILGFNRRDLERLDRFLAASPDELRSLPPDSVAAWVGSITISWTYDGDLSAARRLIDTSPAATPSGVFVRDLAARWIRVLDDAEEEKATFWELGLRLNSRLAPLAVPLADSGQGFLNAIVARGGPEVLADLRADASFVAAALEKAHYQNIYVLELEQASAVLDSLRSASR